MQGGRSMSMNASSAQLKNIAKQVRGAKYFSDDEEEFELPLGFSNFGTGDLKNAISVSEKASTDGCLLSVKGLNKLDDIMNVFYVQHQRFIRMSVSLRKGLTLIDIPRSFLQHFRKSVNGSYFRIALCGFLAKPLYLNKSTKVKAGVVDFRGDDSCKPGSSSQIVTSRNASVVSKTQDINGDFEWLNFVTMPTDQMSFSAVNTAGYFSVKDWMDCKLAFEVEDSIVKQGRSALVIDVFLSVDETNNPNKYKLAAIPPQLIPDRELKLLKGLESIMDLIRRTHDDSLTLSESSGLFFEEGSRSIHQGAQIVNLKAPAVGSIKAKAPFFTVMPS
jgi:hypothetical protein